MILIPSRYSTNKELTMKINDKNLNAFAISKTPVDHEGWLEKRGDVNKAYQKRWFILKGNLLFYFERKGDKEPIGVIILEGCTIELTEEETYSFKIVFHCEDGRTYYLCTDSQASMESWMKALACASYDYMKLMVADLQRQLDEAEAEEQAAAAVMVECTDEPKVPPRGQRYNPFNKTPENGSGKTVQGSRHQEASQQPAAAAATFRELHTTFGRQILADRNEWRAKKIKFQEMRDAEVPALIQL